MKNSLFPCFVIALAFLGHSISLQGATLTVDSLDDPGDGDCATDGCTLREAVAAAADGDEIVFDVPVAAGDTITLSGSHILIDKNLTIDGDPGFIIDANEASLIFR
ncbi:MAG: CSLREA domain-containing protein, partial [Wenzhouxiangella sp.]